MFLGGKCFSLISFMIYVMGFEWENPIVGLLYVALEAKDHRLNGKLMALR